VLGCRTRENKTKQNKKQNRKQDLSAVLETDDSHVGGESRRYNHSQCQVFQNEVIRHVNWGRLNSAGSTSTGYRLE
jgi:hypothetical protein